MVGRGPVLSAEPGVRALAPDGHGRSLGLPGMGVDYVGCGAALSARILVRLGVSAAGQCPNDRHPLQQVRAVRGMGEFGGQVRPGVVQDLDAFRFRGCVGWADGHRRV